MLKRDNQYSVDRMRKSAEYIIDYCALPTLNICFAESTIICLLVSRAILHNQIVVSDCWPARLVY